MQVSSQRRGQAELAKLLYQHRQSTELTWVLDLLDSLLSQAKDELVTATPEAFMKKQGEAVAYEKIRKLITRQSPGTQPE